MQHSGPWGSKAPATPPADYATAPHQATQLPAGDAKRLSLHAGHTPMPSRDSSLVARSNELPDAPAITADAPAVTAALPNGTDALCTGTELAGPHSAVQVEDCDMQSAFVTDAPLQALAADADAEPGAPVPDQAHPDSLTTFAQPLPQVRSRRSSIAKNAAPQRAGAFSKLQFDSAGGIVRHGSDGVARMALQESVGASAQQRRFSLGHVTPQACSCCKALRLPSDVASHTSCGCCCCSSAASASVITAGTIPVQHTALLCVNFQPGPESQPISEHDSKPHHAGHAAPWLAKRSIWQC